MNAIYTIGHSTHPIDKFIAWLRAFSIETVCDIRTIPKSRHNPQFGQAALTASLSEANIGYVYLKSLGGLRGKSHNSINSGWRNASFRNYADYMQTAEFRAGIDDLIDIGTQRQTAIMCAEAVPWRCHRSLVGDALLVRGVKVLDIMSATKATPHKLTPFAHVNELDVTYPGDESDETSG